MLTLHTLYIISIIVVIKVIKVIKAIKVIKVIIVRMYVAVVVAELHVPSVRLSSLCVTVIDFVGPPDGNMYSETTKLALN